MTTGLRHQLAEKMAGEITLSESPGKALKKWRMSFEIAQGVLSEHLGVSPSVISDYESGRRKSPGTAVVGRIVDSILQIDEERGGKFTEKYARMLLSGIGDDVVLDMQDYADLVRLGDFSAAIQAEVVYGSLSKSIYGHTVVNSQNAILRLSADEFIRIYGWSTERALIFSEVSTGKSPMVAIRVTPFKPRCVVLQGIAARDVHPLVPKMADRDRITVLATTLDTASIISTLRSAEW